MEEALLLVHIPRVLFCSLLINNSLCLKGLTVSSLQPGTWLHECWNLLLWIVPFLEVSAFRTVCCFSLKAKRGVCGCMVDLYESSHNSVKCCPSLSGLLGLYMSSKFSSFRMKLSIYWACLIKLQGLWTCGHGQDFQISADYKVKLSQNQKSCTNTEDLKNVLGKET